MSLGHGTSVVRDGLVFNYDMSNLQKSWRGAPTVNLMPNPTFASNLTPWSYQTLGNGSATLDTNVKYKGNNSVRIERTSTGGETNVWLNLSASQGLLPNTQYTFTANCLATAPSQAALFSYFGSTSNGFVYHSGSGKWERLVHTFTTRDTEPYIQIRMFHNSTTLNLPVWFSTIQVEQNTFATPFVAGTRSNTQAILDLTNNNTVTANSLTYNADGSFGFSGSNSLTVPYNPSLFTFNNEQTIIIWMKNEASVATRRNPYNQAYGGAGTITHENNTNFNYFYGTSGINNTPYTAHTSPFSVIFNETAQIAITRNVSQTAWYKNGALGNTRANPYGATVVTGTSPILIGTGYTTGVIGPLYTVQIYNRALTAAEIEQNFEALRGRYGI